ncbi:MAG: hypothetical protein FD143_2701 [Ignavibacteria bacterium]|nr:MAG: hypothetical protein FD143_2701 [Ignavibacteria bacterium]KAF0157779.1 MAG: hypothetical protein FD188_2657 [Ignavibacteria bacterium]
MNFAFINMSTPGAFTPIKKFPIDKIKFNKKFLSYANPVSETAVDWIVNNFHIEGWEPVFLNQKEYLIDGQHRLTAAKKIGLKYMDVAIFDETAQPIMKDKRIESLRKRYNM